MAIEVFLGKKFAQTAENEMFDKLIEVLKRRWMNQEELITVIGNFSINARELDVLIIKNDAICIVDFKNYGGKIIFSENGQWHNHIGTSKNPFQQLREYKFALLKYLENIDIYNHNNIDLGHINGIVLYNERIEFDENDIPKKVKPWFHVVDMENFDKKIKNITSNRTNLSNNEILSISKVFGVGKYKEANISTEKTNQKFSETVNFVEYRLFHNFTNDYKMEGILIQSDFQAFNLQKDIEYVCAAFFYYPDRSNIIDDNTFYGAFGYVATWRKILPDQINPSQFDGIDFDLELPYEELHLAKDRKDILFRIALFRDAECFFVTENYYNLYC